MVGRLVGATTHPTAKCGLPKPSKPSAVLRAEPEHERRAGSRQWPRHWAPVPTPARGPPRPGNPAQPPSPEPTMKLTTWPAPGPSPRPNRSLARVPPPALPGPRSPPPPPSLLPENGRPAGARAGPEPEPCPCQSSGNRPAGTNPRGLVPVEKTVPRPSPIRARCLVWALTLAPAPASSVVRPVGPNPSPHSVPSSARARSGPGLTPTPAGLPGSSRPG